MNIEPNWMKEKPMKKSSEKSRIQPIPEVGKVYQYKGEKVKVVTWFIEDLFCMVKFKTGKLKGREVEALVSALYFVGDKEDE